MFKLFKVDMKTRILTHVKITNNKNISYLNRKHNVC